MVIIALQHNNYGKSADIDKHKIENGLIPLIFLVKNLQ